MKTRAAVAVEAGKPLEVMDVNLEGPKNGEVLVEIKATGICHTDEFTLSGADPEGLFPAILGHEGAGIVVEVGPDVVDLKVGDHVIPLYTPECRQCEYCLHPKTNLCQAIRETQGRGVMPDGTSRFSMLDGTPILHYMGCSTFSNFTVLPEIALAKINPAAPFDMADFINSCPSNLFPFRAINKSPFFNVLSSILIPKTPSVFFKKFNEGSKPLVARINSFFDHKVFNFLF